MSTSFSKGDSSKQSLDSRVVYKVLVAEDDPFQRLSIIDILKYSHFDVTPAENGAQAIEKLMDENNSFDLVLLDLLMPEKSGKDVLDEIMQNKRLSKLPVIMMSAKNDSNIISECLKTGAKSFIIKPLRLQEWKGFVKFIGNSGETTTKQSLSEYAQIKTLGVGAAGQVDLVKHKETGELFALKHIPLSHLNDKEKEAAKREVQFLKVLIGPTLIKAYQNFVEEDNIYIIMEYAEGGTLADKIHMTKFKKQKFSTDVILSWISQAILGVMLMHSKNILHRDLKSLNLFLTKDGILKIGDFGISKQLDAMSDLALTNVGTPYYMAPEVCKGEPYGEKADIWAIGCILYELALLRKPFDADSIQGVFDKIINKPPDMMSEELDMDVRMLITAMLDKDPVKRPSIWDLSYMPCINDRINKFVKEQKWEDSVNCVFETRAYQDDNGKNADEKPKYSVFDINKLDLLAHWIRTDVKMEETKVGWFSGTINCTTGYEILDWIQEHIEKNVKKAEDICEEMMNQEIIYRIDGKTAFQGNHTTLYTFYEDRNDIPSNLLRPWNNPVESALDVSWNLVKLIEQIYGEALVEEEDSTEFHAEEALKSQKYDSFISNIAQLELVDLSFSNENEALCFYLNVYQWMYIHAFLKYMNNFNEDRNEKGLLSKILSYVWGDKKDNFYYNIGGYEFTLEQLKHGLLRGNKKGNTFFRYFSSKDERAQLLGGSADPRILFLCNDLPEVPIHIECFDDPYTLDEKFDYFLSEYFLAKIEIDPVNQDISLPKVFEKYAGDFGGTYESMLKFIWRWYDNSQYTLDQILKLVSKKSLMIKYED